MNNLKKDLQNTTDKLLKKLDGSWDSLKQFLLNHKKLIILATVLYVVYEWLFNEESK